MGRQAGTERFWERDPLWLKVLGSTSKLFSCCIPLAEIMPFSFKILRGTDSETTLQSSYVRFENQTDTAVSVYWFNHTGEEKFYFHLNPRCSITQESFAGNVWLVKDKAAQKLLMRVKVGSMRRQLCCVRQIALFCTANPAMDEPTEPDLGLPVCYVRRVDTQQGIRIVGYSQVSMEALQAAKDVVENILQGCSKRIVDELLDHNCKVAVMARDQVTTDILEHSHLRGSSVFDGRDWDSQVRGLGGTKAIPTCSVGEENVLRRPHPEDKYYQESILIHEFAHTIMEVAFDSKMMERIIQIYQRSKSKYSPGIYMAVDEKEYWAEGSESWFNASLRNDVNDGVNTREKLKGHDPELAQLLFEIYGDGDWRYDFTPLPMPPV